MMVETASGDLAVTPGKQITFYAAASSEAAPVAAETGGMTRNQKIGLGVAAAAIVAAGAFALAGGGGGSSSGGGGGGSPAAP